MNAVAPKRWDFFVSYTASDRDIAVWIAGELEAAGYTVRIQEWDFVPGRNWLVEMNAAVQGADRTIAVLSQAYLNSTYGTMEWLAAWGADPAGTGRKLIPVRVQADCERPGFLHGVVGFDLFDPESPDARERLLTGIQAAVTDRYRPARPRGSSVTRKAWRRPSRNPHFTGRETELAQVEQVLAHAVPGAVTVLIVRGLGGIGKSALATEYGHRHRTEYDWVGHVPANEPDVLWDGFAVLLDAHRGDLRAQVHRLLATSARWLLIVDDADPAADIEAWLPAELAADQTGHVIVTTTRGRCGLRGAELPLDVLSQAEAVALLSKEAPYLNQDEDVAAGIVAELGCLPLAITQAGEALNASKEPGGDYLKRLRALDGASAELVAERWRASLDWIQTERPAASQLLTICAYLATEPIPLDLFTSHPGGPVPDALSSAIWGARRFDEGTAAVLVDHALATRAACGPVGEIAGLQVHRLVRDVVRFRLRRDEADWRPLSGALHLLRVHVPDEPMRDPGTWPRWQALLPHVRSVAWHVDRVRDADQSLLWRDASWLLDRAASFQQARGRLSDAEALMRDALRLAEAPAEPNKSVISAREVNLAAILRTQGDAQQALSWANQAVKHAEAAYGVHHPAVAASLNCLGMILLDLHRPQEALAPLVRAVESYEETASSPDFADCLTSFALVLFHLGQTSQARGLLGRALELNERAYGLVHPAVAVTLRHLATILDDPAEAGELSDRATAIRGELESSPAWTAP